LLEESAKHTCIDAFHLLGIVLVLGFPNGFKEWLDGMY